MTWCCAPTRLSESEVLRMSETVTATPTYVEEVDAIIEAMQGYIEGARTGIGATMKSTFHAMPRSSVTSAPTCSRVRSRGSTTGTTRMALRRTW